MQIGVIHLTDIDNVSSKNTFASNLKRIMQKKNIKSKDLANAVGLSKSAISNYIAGISMPRAELLSKIAGVLDVSVDALICRAKTTFKEDFDASLFYEVPLFSALLSTSQQVYRNDNFNGSIALPFPPYGDFQCYAIKVIDESVSCFGITRGSIVLFAANTEVKNGQLAAVLLKDQRKVVIRRVSFEKEEMILSAGENSTSYPLNEENLSVEILGKVIFATFFPNM